MIRMIQACVGLFFLLFAGYIQTPRLLLDWKFYILSIPGAAIVWYLAMSC